jgi:hypothetical protein
MARTSRSNLPQDVPLKWNVEKGAVEFGLSIMTLRKALAKTSATPDSDGLYTTRQIVAALYGALHQEKVRTQKELADRYMLENAITRREVLNRAEVERVLAAIADAMVSRIMASGVPRSVKEDLLKELSSIPIALKEVAHRQSRLSRGNGKHPEEDESED